MEYFRTVTLKDGRECIIRNGTQADGQAALDNYLLTHEQTDNLLAYADEATMTAESEGEYLQREAQSDTDVQLVAVVDGKLVAMAGVNSLGKRYKIRHRGELGISVDKELWGFGIGNALMASCIECAKKMSFEQVELEVIAGNDTAMHLYEKYGFVEYGRNPKGLKSRYTGYQETVLMRLDLTENK